MDSSLPDYTFKEIIGRPDKGAGWFPCFVFTLTGKEVLSLYRTMPRHNPSLKSAPAPEFLDDAGCYLAAAEFRGNKPVIIGKNAVAKDLYGIFATLAYIAIHFGRDSLVEISAPGCPDKKIHIDHKQFNEASSGLLESAHEFYEGIFAYMFYHPDAERLVGDHLIVKLSTLQSYQLN